jgi:mono/diheme cytochrome c family protein
VCVGAVEAQLQALPVMPLTQQRSGLLVATLLLLVPALPPLAQTRPSTPPLVITSMYGRDLYAFYCASCHGRDGTGSGPVTSALKKTPPDLTRLSIRNGGVFPRARMEAIVTGAADPPLPVHGSREMPVWGPIFRGLDSNESVNRQRIGNILDYLESLQVRYATLSQPLRREAPARLPAD